jgi:hypothetical protein
LDRIYIGKDNTIDMKMKPHTREHKIPSFGDFVAEGLMIAGFGPAMQIPNMGGASVPTTGYSMKPIAYHIEQLSTIAAREAHLYESDADPDHKGDEYIEEVKRKVCEMIDEMYNSVKA